VLNNIIHHCNQSGVQLNGREWFYTIHNTVYHNSWTSGFNGSGISYFAIQCIEAGVTNCFTSAIAGQPANAVNYTPSGDDTAPFNGLSAWSPFHNVVAWNIAYNNRVTRGSALSCNAHTDGNGIILDTFRDGFAYNLQYPYQTLVMNNVAYYNGGKGIHTFRGVNITFANNSAFNNNTDTCMEQNGWVVGDLASIGSGNPPGDGSNNTWINNLSESVQGPFGWTASIPHGPNHCALTSWGAGDVNKVYTNNIFSTGESGSPVAPEIHACLGDNDVNYVSCTNNLCGTDPGFVNATPGTVGDVNGNPVGGTWIPGNHNLAITGASPANNYVVSPAPSWLPAQNTDAGACHHSLTTCPNPGTSNF
jgi:parallel beta-helix repeat protein